MGTVSLVLKQCVTGAQSQCPERPKLRMSRFGVRRGSAIETAAVERVGTLVVPQTHLSQVRSEAACIVRQWKGEWERQEVTVARGHLGASMGPRKTMKPLCPQSIDPR